MALCRLGVQVPYFPRGALFKACMGPVFTVTGGPTYQGEDMNTSQSK
jgi:hypothetical protein